MHGDHHDGHGDHGHGDHGHGAHGHSHGHGHGAHGHSHGHAHAPRAAEPDAVVNPPLERSAGQGKVLFFDAFSGVAGDMTIGALLDLGVPIDVVQAAIEALPVGGYSLVRKLAFKSGIAATKFDVAVTEEQPHRTYGEIRAMLDASSLDGGTLELAQRIFLRLGEAEAFVHRTPLEAVHFHEVGAVDAIVDIVGSAAALTYLGARVEGSPLPLGRGFVRAAHGPLPLPAPATLTCLKGYPTLEDPLDAELVTPTGAAIIATVTMATRRWPKLSAERIGYGAGTKDLPDRPNLLRVVLGTPETDAPQSHEAADELDASLATHVLVETTVDDMTGELIAAAIQALLAAGALDAWALSATMKKGRPGFVLSALARRAQRSEIGRVMLQQTRSIGLRFQPIHRWERPRRMVTVRTRFGDVPVKISEGDVDPPVIKPEFDAAHVLARQAGVPVREVLDAALAAAREAAQLGSL